MHFTGYIIPSVYLYLFALWHWISLATCTHTRAHLETANGHVHLTAAFIRTVEHLQHAVCLDYWTPPAPLGPDTQTHAFQRLHEPRHD